ncbi:FAD binding domain-containing protein [Colletotrichum acutatum]
MASQDHHGIKKVEFTPPHNRLNLPTQTSTNTSYQQVIVIGTGPTGLLLSLLLARHSIPVLVLDKSTSLDTQPRATHYAAPANRVLSRANLLSRVRQHGIEVGGARWRKPDGTVLAKIENSRLGVENPDRISCLPLNSLCKMALEDLEKEPAAEVRWGYEVEGIREEEGRAVVRVKTEEGVEELGADYVVGCDGANSIIRRQLFGDEFPGYTWDLQIIATNTEEGEEKYANQRAIKVYYDFEKHGWKDSNFVIHPTDYFMAAKIQDDGLWRVSYGEVPGLSHDEYRARQPAKYETMLPGNPKADNYQIVNFSPYKVHQQLAPRMRTTGEKEEEDLLALHLSNLSALGLPSGGMGLTGGIVDVGDLFDCLTGIHDGQADDDILDKYDHYRREKFNQFTNPVSEANLKRMTSDPDEVETNDPGIVAMRGADKTDEAAVAFQLTTTWFLLPVPIVPGLILKPTDITCWLNHDLESHQSIHPSTE